MKKDEIIYEVDIYNNEIGPIERSKAHSTHKIIHREVVVLLFNIKGQALVGMRSKTKKINPGIWTVPCAGHIDYGEDIHKAAQRELEEELGITDKITYYGNKFLSNLGTEARFFYIYSLITDQKEFKSDPAEFEFLEWKGLDEVYELIKPDIHPESKYSLETIIEAYQNISK